MNLLKVFEKQLKFEKIDRIVIPEDYPKQVVELSKLVSLAEKYKDAPLPVLCDADKNLFVGELYLRILRFAELFEVPCLDINKLSLEQIVILLKEYGETDLLSIYELIKFMKYLHEVHGLSHQELGEMFGISRVAVTNRLRLLTLPYDVLYGLVNDQISEGHARALLALKKEDLILYAYSKVIEKNLSVRETEQMVREVLGRQKQSRKRSIEFKAEVDSTLNRIILTFASAEDMQAFIKKSPLAKKLLAKEKNT